jgi:Tfp pilus assembly protein PilO
MRLKKIKLWLRLFIVGNVLAIAIGALLVKTNERQKTEVIDIIKTIAKEDNKIRHLEDLKEFARKIASDQNMIHKQFIPSKGEVAFIEFVENLGSSTGVNVKIDSADVDSSSKTDHFGTVSFRVETTGRLKANMNFLKKLEYSPYALTMKRVDISTVDDTRKSWRGVFEFIVHKINSNIN